MAARTPSVVLTHPGRHYHFYQIALAAQEAGMLARFITAIYYKPRNFPYSLLEALLGRIAGRRIEQLKTKRTMAGLNPQLVVSMPYFELATLGFGRLPVARDVVSHMALVLLNNAVFDWWVSKTLPREHFSILHSMYDCAWRSFAQAKCLDAVTVLDMPANPFTHQYVEGENERLGSKGATLSSRSRAEIELADYVFAPSDFVIKDLVAYGFPAERVFKIPWAVDTELFRPGPEKSNGSFQVLFVGNIDVRKGFHYLLEAVKQLRLPGLQVIIIGHPVDKLSKQILHRYAGLFSWIPRVLYQELHRWYQASDLFVFPSLAEGSAMVTYEAMACGLPLVVTENSGSLVRDGVDGFVIPVRDVEAIKEKIALLYQDRCLARKMGQAARAAVEDYTWKRYRERVVSAYRQIVQTRCSS